jgi:hypothetical protein
MNAELAHLHGRLENEPGELHNLLQVTQRLEALNSALRQWADEPWLDAIRVANLRGDTLVLFADSASALVPLRYRREALLAFLRERYGLTATRIEAKVRPSLERRERESKRAPEAGATFPFGSGDKRLRR